MNHDHKRLSAWTCLRFAHGVRCLCDRSWTFFLPLYLSRQCPSKGLRPTAALKIVQSLAIAVLSAPIASAYRKHLHTRNSSQFIFIFCVAFENAAVVLQGILLSQFATVSVRGESNKLYCEAPFRSASFCMVLLCAVVDSVFSSFLSMIISKEWVATLFKTEGGGKLYDLSKANAALSQIDLVVAALSPLLVSFGLQELDGAYNKLLFVLGGMQATGAFVISHQARQALKNCPDLAKFSTLGSDGREINVAANGRLVAENHNSVVKKHCKGLVRETLDLCYGLSLPIRLSIVAYVLLYCTILSSGGLLSVWLNNLPESVRVSEGWIATFGSASQFCGALATILAPTLIRLCRTMEKAAVVSQWFQALFILLAAACFFRLELFSEQITATPQDTNAPKLVLVAFLTCVSISRVGLWMFDLVERQMLQLSVSRDQQTLLFNAERGATQLASLGMMYLCYRFPNPSEFYLLVNMSTGTVCTAAVLLFCQLVISEKTHQAASTKKSKT